MDPKNALLGRVGVMARRSRDRFWGSHDFITRLSSRFGRQEGGLWFRTKGCHHDSLGGCVMCEYGTGPQTEAHEMVAYVQEGLSAIARPCWHLLVSPSGSMLDEWEVPPAARELICKVMRESCHETFSFETRAETVNPTVIDRCNYLLGGRLHKIYMGLESANPWISKYCINKGLCLDDFEAALHCLRQAGVRSASNVLVGAPFLSTAETIEDAISSVQWALDRGSDECFLFPVHVKYFTPLLHLHQKDLYSPPSLWSLVEVIWRLGPDIAQKHIRLSWYTAYGAGNVLDSPTTCEVCYESTIELLDRFAEFGDFELIHTLNQMECHCKDQWRADLIRTPIGSLPDRVAVGYQVLAEELLGYDWWQRYRAEILEGLYAPEDTSALD